jgi:hypothetical protein
MAVLLVAVIRSTRGPARKIHDINAILWISARVEMNAGPLGMIRKSMSRTSSAWKPVFRKRSCIVKYPEPQ